jgi:hypothetical protein
MLAIQGSTVFKTRYLNEMALEFSGNVIKVFKKY